VTSPWAEVADRVWIRRYESLDQTIGVIGGSAGLVVIDTRATHRLADELRDELGHLPGRLAAVVNTHGHWDHAFGNARFTPTPIWGHIRCRAMVLDRGEEARARLIEELSSEADDFREVVLTPPTDLFEEEATLDLGDRLVELRYLGRGHTDNDIVITVPGASVLFAGDLLENAPAPAFGDSFPIAWAETGQRLLGMVDGAVVPGHGDPFDLAFAERQVGELASLAALGSDVVDGAIGLDDAVERSPYPPEVTREAFARIRLERVEITE
jgi:glyoxylase-like metal-dependent hydrolase (beta-lactamase superfamily II)